MRVKVDPVTKRQIFTQPVVAIDYLFLNRT